MQTGNQAINFEIKSQLAKLLATENISMRHEPNSKTAYFDVKKRELILPVWQNISEDLYDMLVVHEVGHALDTPMDKWMDAIDSISKQHHELPTNKNKNAIKGFLNVIEDTRIDKRQKRRYPGSRRNYVIGYKELYERDFFGISKRDVNTMTFIDRINIFFKNGAIFNIKFSADERVFIKRIENAETFEDVVTIASDIYKFSIDNRDFKKTPVNNDSSEEEMEIEIETTSSDVDGNMENFEEIENDDIEDTGAPYSITDEDVDGNEEEDNVITNDTQGGSAETESNEIEAPETELAAENSIKSIILDDEYRYVYLNTPEFIHANIVDDYTVVIPQMDDAYKQLISYGHDWRSINNDLIKFKKAEQDTISFMIKEFEMRKAADTYARVSVSKTGIIDTNKIYSYKYNDDIFKKLSIVPTGKNHGFVMFLDWSGSMITDLRNTMKQLFSLVMFCKRVQIPFEVYAFRTSSYDERVSGKSMIKNETKANMEFNGFKLRNILSSRMNTQTLNKAFELLWFVSSYQSGQYHCDRMDSTPLNQTILAADYVINKFKKETKVQIVNTIFLTDGASDPIGINYTNANYQYGNFKGNKIFIRDHVTKKNYYVNSIKTHSTTEVFLKMLKDRTDCNLIGFFITRSLTNVSNLLNIDPYLKTTMNKKFRQDNYVGITTAGYDEYYIVNINKASETTNLDVNSDMTQKAVLKAFMKYSEKKTTNRVMLSKFMHRVAA